jgi:hypothetical protein
MKSICLLGLVLCAACGATNAVGGSTAGKNEVGKSDVASSAGPSSNATPADKPTPSAKDGGSGGW